MNRVEQIKDISARTGLDEAIIRQVWSGTRESIVESLKKGENYDLYGMCSFKPVLRTKAEGTNFIDYKSVRVSVSKVLKRDINQGISDDYMDEEEVSLNIVDPDVLTYELDSLK